MDMVAMHGSLKVMQEEDFVDVVKVKDGGYGSVYRGKHVELGYLAAIKKLKAVSGADEDSLRFCADLLKEISILERIRHPHIVYVYGCIYQPNCIALVMELAEYGSLKDFLQTLLPEQPPVSLIVRMMHQTVLGMVFLHSQTPSILHLDLKAANILLMSDLTVKITDFGLSEWRQYQQQHTTSLMKSDNAVMRGTLTHVPPEKLTDLNVVPGKKYDVYGFAILSWELASSKRAFDRVPLELLYSQVPKGQRPDMKLVHRDLPPVIRQLISDCWHVDPVQRHDFIDIKRTTEDVLHRYDSTIKSDEIELKNLIYRRQNSQNPDVQPISPSCPVPVADTKPMKELGGSSTHLKCVDAEQAESVAAGNKSSAATRNGASSAKDTRPDVGVKRSTDTFAFNTDLSALKSSSRTASSASLPSVVDVQGLISSLQLNGQPASTPGWSTSVSTAATTVPGLGKVTDRSQSLCFESDAAPPDQAAAAATPSAGRAASRPESGTATQQTPGSGATARGSANGSSGSLGGSTRSNTPVASLIGPNSQIPQQQQQQQSQQQPKVPSASTGYPQYVPHKGGFLYYPCPGVPPVHIPAVDGKVPPGMPAAGSMYPPDSSNQPNVRTVTGKNGSTHIIQSGGVSNTQIGNKNIMYIGGMPGVPTRNGGSVQPAKPFDKSKITKSRRKITDEDINLLADHVGNSWKSLARKLKFSDGQIDGFDHDHKTLYEQTYQMLLRFRQRYGDDATLDKVVAALCDIQKPEVASLLYDDAPTGGDASKAFASRGLAMPAGGSASSGLAVNRATSGNALTADPSSTVPVTPTPDGGSTPARADQMVAASGKPPSLQDLQPLAKTESLDDARSKSRAHSMSAATRTDHTV